MKLRTCLVLVAAVGCAQPGPSVSNSERTEIFDKIWDALQKHESVWLDRMEMADGPRIESKLKALNPETPVTGAQYGIVLGCHVAGLDVTAMTDFHRELKKDPALSRTFSHLILQMQWTVMDRKDLPERFQIDFDVILVNTGQS